MLDIIIFQAKVFYSQISWLHQSLWLKRRCMEIKRQKMSGHQNYAWKSPLTRKFLFPYKECNIKKILLYLYNFCSEQTCYLHLGCFFSHLKCLFNFYSISSKYLTFVFVSKEITLFNKSLSKISLFPGLKKYPYGGIFLPKLLTN